MKEFNARVIYNKKLRDNFYVISVDLDKSLKSEILPGQFAMIGTDRTGGLLLRRPYSILDAQTKRGKTNLKFFYKTVGKGSEKLSGIRKDDVLSLLAPLGNGFSPKKTKHKTVCVVTGGTGIPPFYLLIRTIKKFNPRAIYVFYGAKTKNEIFYAPFFKEKTKGLFISTDDGSRGYRGFVTDLFKNELENHKELAKLKANGIICLTCGPRIMMKKTAGICKERSISCYASMEEVMGCGMGACLSCVVKKSDSGETLITICKDGPVFNSCEIQM